MKRIEIRDLTIERGTFRLNVPGLSVAGGEVLAVCGPSGSGKTSLLEAIAGFLPASGDIQVDGTSIRNLPPERRRVGMVFQRSVLFPHLNVQQNVSFGLRIQGVAKSLREKQARDWLSKVGLEGLALRDSMTLSEGQGQRVALARVLAVGFPVLLLDEPFSALDAENRKSLRVLIRKLVEETKVAAILVSHHADDIEGLADARYVLGA